MICFTGWTVEDYKVKNPSKIVEEVELISPKDRGKV